MLKNIIIFLLVVGIVGISGAWYYTSKKNVFKNDTPEKNTSLTSTPTVYTPPTTQTPTPTPYSENETPTPTRSIAKTYYAPKATNSPIPTTTQIPGSQYDLTSPTGAVKVIVRPTVSYYPETKKVITLYAISGAYVLVNQTVDHLVTTVYEHSAEVVFSALPAGPYSVRLEYADAQFTGFYSTDVKPGQTSTINIDLP